MNSQYYGSWKRSLYAVVLVYAGEKKHYLSKQLSLNQAHQTNLFFTAFNLLFHVKMLTILATHIKNRIFLIRSFPLAKELHIYEFEFIAHHKFEGKKKRIFGHHGLSVYYNDLRPKIPNTQFQLGCCCENGTNAKTTECVGMQCAIFDFVECNVQLHKRWVHIRTIFIYACVTNNSAAANRNDRPSLHSAFFFSFLYSFEFDNERWTHTHGKGNSRIWAHFFSSDRAVWRTLQTKRKNKKLKEIRFSKRCDIGSETVWKER